MKNELEQAIAAAVKDLFGAEIKVELTRPDEQFGDYATNVALQLYAEFTKAIDGHSDEGITWAVSGHPKSPRDVAELIKSKLDDSSIKGVDVAGPGFLNIRLSDQALLQALTAEPAKSLAGQSIVAEYSDPNPFKVLHAGHLYTSLVGDAVARLMEYAGAKVHRVNFGGDVGLHVGKTMWAIIQDLGGEHPEKLEGLAEDTRLEWLSQRYVVGNTAYEEDAQAKEEITAVNKRVYELHTNNDKQSAFAQIYWTCREWSYQGFDQLYKQLDMVPFEKYYPESAVADLGLETVKKHTGSVYEQSDGAVVFRGEQFGLFTQVFINSEGLPTYAGKDVGLIFHKQRDFNPDRSFIITDHAQKDHLAVVMKSISQFAPKLVEATTHYTHGQIKMAGGVKMSSRLGNILRASDILVAALSALKATGRSEKEEIYNDIYLGAVKYALLKNRVGGDIVYDPKESVSLEGNSGPYLQYAHARARSILAKAELPATVEINDLEDGERSLVRKLGEYAETVDKAVAELMPHHICTYLYELAQTFNRFYENNRVIDSDRQAIRLQLVLIYADTLKRGLNLLGVASPDKM